MGTRWEEGVAVGVGKVWKVQGHNIGKRTSQAKKMNNNVERSVGVGGCGRSSPARRYGGAL